MNDFKLISYFQETGASYHEQLEWDDELLKP